MKSLLLLPPPPPPPAASACGLTCSGVSPSWLHSLGFASASTAQGRLPFAGPPLSSRVLVTGGTPAPNSAVEFRFRRPFTRHSVPDRTDLPPKRSFLPLYTASSLGSSIRGRAAVMRMPLSPLFLRPRTHFRFRGVLLRHWCTVFGCPRSESEFLDPL